MARSIAFEALVTVVFVWVDDWYQLSGACWPQGKVGAKPVFRDNAVMPLLLLMDFRLFPGEIPFLAFLRAHYLAHFPRRLSQRQFNRRVRSLARRVEERRRHWAPQLGATLASLYLLDTKPLPVLGYRRDQEPE